MSKKSFKEAYGVLQRNSEALRNQREPNIDDLLTIVTESVEAYKVCTSRIDAVEQALEQALGGAGIATSSAASGPEPASLSGSDHDDVPVK
jgi:exodeoxyribonuclease VII small subunit